MFATVKGRNPIRVIIDGKLSIPIKSKILNSNDPENTWIFTSKEVDVKKVKVYTNKGIKIFKINSLKYGHLSIKIILKVLAKNKITSLLVEGGSEIFTQFLDKDLFDEIYNIAGSKNPGTRNWSIQS